MGQLKNQVAAAVKERRLKRDRQPGIGRGGEADACIKVHGCQASVPGTAGQRGQCCIPQLYLKICKSEACRAGWLDVDRSDIYAGRRCRTEISGRIQPLTHIAS